MVKILVLIAAVVAGAGMAFIHKARDAGGKQDKQAVVRIAP